MKIYHTRSGLLLEEQGQYYLHEAEWDEFINDDELGQKCARLCQELKPVENGEDLLGEQLLAPIGHQEVWASGVTYYQSKIGREEEAKAAGGSDFYARVYLADRPELFFKATAARVSGPGDPIRIRKDSTWDVPEPELTLVVTSNAKIVGYTIGNDMSSRSIEGENPLYLPQAKTYDASAALGPCILVSEAPLPDSTGIHLEIKRQRELVFTGQTDLSQLKRKPDDLVEYLCRETSFPYGVFLMTGTGIVPGSDFTLQPGDEVTIAIDGIGSLTNTVEKR
ncbi:fumarylacetoacetate hydrolase family protein [Flavilitoribacter nigricans]|uniref:2-hydroxyhepta-2,4-diene-1,7-dioate isomerase n=1 Tax=Flavilitoribacter nigricans (strain ATCC 23147 / DSM 23189 / NBRC 102662 / NCIMB 1420 / SS-2) TaxID=1122177 RepID=A0A2D0NKS6_FLAN2|nr:fumarylacetoacetate hydrolase family protein [Flavilitoribacter nigricans]PHN08343.1 2-hydroxyhepta-2,4-diene-1,7-dioate isomerase [Flavilitoribacter nigricans DSM 23189 = NBRC 102662]